jgi:hypothetical protein
MVVTEVNIPFEKRQIVEDWCIKNISARLYWIHNKRGGAGWHIDGANGATVKIEDGKKAMLMILECL